MNLLNKIIIGFVFLVVAVSFAQEEHCKATVTIKSDINNFLVFVNGEVQQNSNNFELNPGNYVLKLVENNSNWNSREITDTIVIKDCNTINLNYSFLNHDIYLQSNPQDAHVIVNDSTIGFTPLLLSNGYQNLILSKEGYADKIVTQDELKSSQIINLDFIGTSQSTEFYGSTKFLILAGAAIALGAATAYYKLKADDKFDEYQITGQRNLLDQTNKLDLISGITFTAMQIDFGAIIYFFLTE
jgi:PEGA domain